MTELTEVILFSVVSLRYFLLKPFQPCVTFHEETSRLFYCAKQITDFCMKCNTVLKRLFSFWMLNL